MNATIEWSNRTIELIIHSLEAVELMLILASIILNGFFMYIFIKAPLFHENLIRLFKCLYLAFLVMTSARIVVLCGELTGFDTGEQKALTPEILKIPVFGFCELIQCYSLVYVLTVMASVVFERILATIMLKFYENWIKDWFFVTTACLQLSSTTLITAAFYTGIANILYIGIFLLVCACIGGAIPFILDRINQRHYRESQKYHQTAYTLSERYQLVENIRVARIMKRTIIALIILNSLVLPVFMSIYFFENNQLLRAISIELFHYMIVIYQIVFPIIGIFSTDAWRRQIKKEINKVVKFLRSAKVSDKLGKDALLYLKTVDGRRMTFSIDEEREFYFSQLGRAWN